MKNMQTPALHVDFPMVEVFKTNVTAPSEAAALVATLQQYFPNSKINFDLDDCDKILRVEGSGYRIETVIGLLKNAGFSCQVLE